MMRWLSLILLAACGAPQRATQEARSCGHELYRSHAAGEPHELVERTTSSSDAEALGRALRIFGQGTGHWSLERVCGSDREVISTWSSVEPRGDYVEIAEHK